MDVSPWTFIRTEIAKLPHIETSIVIHVEFALIAFSYMKISVHGVISNETTIKKPYGLQQKSHKDKHLFSTEVYLRPNEVFHSIGQLN